MAIKNRVGQTRKPIHDNSNTLNLQTSRDPRNASNRSIQCHRMDDDECVNSPWLIDSEDQSLSVQHAAVARISSSFLATLFEALDEDRFAHVLIGADIDSTVVASGNHQLRRHPFTLGYERRQAER